MYEREQEEVLRLLGIKPGDVIPPHRVPEIQEEARRLVHLLREQREAHRKAQAYYDRGSLGNWIGPALLDIAVPPKPVRDILEEALIEAHLPSNAVRGLYYTPWNVAFDFAFPHTRLCIVLDDTGRDVTDRILIGKGWFVLPLKEGDIRRNAAAVAQQVKQQHWALKAMKSRKA